MFPQQPVQQHLQSLGLMERVGLCKSWDAYQVSPGSAVPLVYVTCVIHTCAHTRAHTHAHPE